MAGDDRLWAQHPAHVVELEAYYVDIDEVAWCNTCLLPSAVTFTQLLVNARNLCVVCRRRYIACRECGNYELCSD